MNIFSSKLPKKMKIDLINLKKSAFIRKDIF